MHKYPVKIKLKIGVQIPIELRISKKSFRRSIVHKIGQKAAGGNWELYTQEIESLSRYGVGFESIYWFIESKSDAEGLKNDTKH